MSAHESGIVIDEILGPCDDLEIIVTWLLDTWGREKGATREETRDWCLGVIASRVEAMFAAKVDGVAAGVVSMVECDVDHEHGLTPWLATLFVAPEHRGGEVAARLIGTVQGRALVDGYWDLYLYCYEGRLVGYYEAAGWRALRSFERDGRRFCVMAKPLAFEVELGS